MKYRNVHSKAINTHHITFLLIEIHGRHLQIQWKDKLRELLPFLGSD